MKLVARGHKPRLHRTKNNKHDLSPAETRLFCFLSGDLDAAIKGTRISGGNLRTAADICIYLLDALTEKKGKYVTRAVMSTKIELDDKVITSSGGHYCAIQTIACVWL